jgi:hypothetical protein
MTKDRITNVLGVLGAIFCLVAVLTGFGHASDNDDDAPAAPPPTGQVVPAPGGPSEESTAPAAPAAPAAPQDDDGDDDG